MSKAMAIEYKRIDSLGKERERLQVVFGDALLDVVNLVAAHQGGQAKHAAGQEHARLVVKQALRVHHQHRDLLPVGLVHKDNTKKHGKQHKE